jgi:hypothetical protein
MSTQDYYRFCRVVGLKLWRRIGWRRFLALEWWRLLFGIWHEAPKRSDNTTDSKSRVWHEQGLEDLTREDLTR